jgi:hypothetical protein
MLKYITGVYVKKSKKNRSTYYQFQLDDKTYCLFLNKHYEINMNGGDNPNNKPYYNLLEMTNVISNVDENDKEDFTEMPL